MTQEKLEQGKQEIELVVVQLDNLVKDMDVKLNGVLKRQELDYLKGYSIYVREKERELRELVVKVSEKSQANQLKDEIIFQLKNTIKHNYEEAQKSAKLVNEQRERIKVLESKFDILQSDRNFV